MQQHAARSAAASAALRPLAAKDEEEEEGGQQGGGAMSVSRLWESVHTIHYRLSSDVEAEEARATKEDLPSHSPQKPSKGDVSPLSPLAELLLDPLGGKGSGLSTLEASQPCKEVLALLQVRPRRTLLQHSLMHSLLHSLLLTGC